MIIDLWSEFGHGPFEHPESVQEQQYILFQQIHTAVSMSLDVDYSTVPETSAN